MADKMVNLKPIFWILALQILGFGEGQTRNIKLVAMSGNQYWFSSSSPYAPTLNFHLAYQYCRTLGLQLVTLETKEEMDLIGSYLKSTDVSGNGKRDYWTSGNKLGSDTWIWMSSGEQLNSTFSDFWLQQKLQVSTPVNGRDKNCMAMQNLHKRTGFAPEECNKSLPFICEQLRCLYYNYPVTPFPDPEATAEIAALRADFEGITASSESRSKSRLSDSSTDEEQFRNYLFTSRGSSNPNSNSDRTSSINNNVQQRRLTYRPPINLIQLEAASSTNKDNEATSSSVIPLPYVGKPTGRPALTELVVEEGVTTPKLNLPTSTDVNFFTVKQVVVSKSEKVSYSTNHSNIYGVSIQAIDNGDNRPTDIIILTPSSVEDGPGVTETVYYDDGLHTETALPESVSPTKETRENPSHLESEPEQNMFSLHRSRTPVSWSFGKGN